MNSHLTIRLSEQQKRQLRRLASKLGKSDSELVRQMIERELAAETLGRRVAHLKGLLPASPSEDDSLSRTVRERNWRT